MNPIKTKSDLSFKKLSSKELKLVTGGNLADDFNNIRERFDAEMRKMEEEMSRFPVNLQNGIHNILDTIIPHKH
ncbi:bacteriocin [Chryseobacterium sp. c4a]|uniref:bacteriocin n=1 Tax=Chryseobacterium sp. c4a TaxID=1573582 RepID=UPI001357A3D3|nr:bacteriocin [Chryseobacterium sp. c4a]